MLTARAALVCEVWLCGC